MSKDLEVKHYKVLSLSPNLDKNAVYYLFDKNTGKVKTYITTNTGIPIPLIDLTTIGSVLSVTGTGVSGTSTNPKVDIATFVSSQLGNQVYLSLSDGKLQVNPITSPDNSIEVVSTSTELQLQLAAAIQSQINTALQPGANISELTNDVGYLTVGDLVGTDLTYTPSSTNGVVESSTGTDAIIPLAGILNAGLLSPAEKVDIASAIQPSDLAIVATTGDYGDLINVPTEFTPEAHTHSITDISGTKAEFNTSLTDGNFLFVGDITQYTDEAAQDAVGTILTDTTTIDLSYNDGSNQITADLKNTTVVAGIYGTGQTIPTITFDAQGRATNVVTQAVDITSTFVSDFNEAAQDAIGSILTDTSTIDLSYNDGSNIISADVKLNSIDATHLNDSINVSEFVNDADYATKAYADALVVSVFRPAGSWNASSNTFPTTGTGTAGAIRNGDTYNTTVTGTPSGFETLDVGDSFYAIVDNPGQTAANWKKFEANTQQSTESLRGTARIVTQTVIEDASTTNDTDIVTAKKFYLGWEKIKTLAQTFAAKITFTTAPRFNSGTANTVPYLDSNKDLTSSVVTPTELGYSSGVTSSIQTQLNSKEDLANKSTSTSLGTSNILYPTQNAVKVYVDGKVTQTITNGVTTTTPSEDAVYDALQNKLDRTSTALISGCTFVNNGATFTINSGVFQIIDNSTIPYTKTTVNFTGVANVTPLYFRTILYIDSTGTVVQVNGATGDLTPLQRRNNLFISTFAYSGGVILAPQFTPSIDYDISGRLFDLAETLGARNRDGNIISANGANLQLNKGAGHTYRVGSNYATDKKSPDVTEDVAIIPIPGSPNLIGYRNGSGGWTYEAYTGSLTPTFWDNGTGTKATVSNNKFTIPRVYFFNGTNTFVIYLGQTEYSSLDAAKGAIYTETRAIDPATSLATHRCSIPIEKGATSLSTQPTLVYFENHIDNKSSSGIGGNGGAQNMQSGYNNSVAPQITTSTALGAVDLQRGSTADTDNVFRILNGAGTSTLSVAGNGNISSSGIFTSIGGINLDSGLTSSSTGAVISTSSVGGNHIYINSKNNGFGARLLTTSIATSIKDFTFPNTSGTFALTSDLSSYAPLASPTFTGTPSLPTGTIGVTQTAGDSSTKLATTAFVRTQISAEAILLSGNQSFSGAKAGSNGLGKQMSLLGTNGSIEASSGTSSTTPALYVSTSTSNAAIRAVISGAGTGDFLNCVGSDTTTKSRIDSSGNITATSFIKSGATAGNILLAGGTDIVQSTFATATGGTGYIQNQNASAQSANMWISGSGKFDSNLTTSGTNGNSFLSIVNTTNSSLLQIENNSGGNNIYSNANVPLNFWTNGINRFNIAANGAATFASTVTASNGTLIGGTLTSGYIPKATGTNSLGNSIISDSGSGITVAGSIISTDGTVNIRTISSSGVGYVGTSTNHPLAFQTNADEKMRITSGGNVLIGTTTDDGVNKLQVNGGFKIVPSDSRLLGGDSVGRLIVSNSDTTSYLSLYGSSHSTTPNLAQIVVNNAVAVSIPASGVVKINNLSGTGTRNVVADASGELSAPVSDISLKENIEPIGYGLKELMQMNPVWFTFKEEYKNYGASRQNGNIAQEMEKIIPEATFTTPSTGKMGISYEQLDAVYIKSIQQQQEIIEKLILRIEQLESNI